MYNKLIIKYRNESKPGKTPITKKNQETEKATETKKATDSFEEEPESRSEGAD